MTTVATPSTGHPGVRARRLGAGALIAIQLMSGTACSDSTPRIEANEVERIVSTLAADSMLGRGAFGPGIESARAFLEGEFERAGLQPPEGQSGFAQVFSVYSTRVDAVSVTLDGASVTGERVAASLAGAALRWRPEDDVSVVSVAAADDLGEALNAARRAASDALLLVDPAHGEEFERFRRFMSRPSRSMEEAAGSVVMVLLEAPVAPNRPPHFDVRARGVTQRFDLANIVGTIPGRRSNEVVLFSAHYDHVGIRAGESDSIANGANDDASGTTAVVALARYFAQLDTPERTLMFAAFTAEESGGYGSRYFSQRLDPAAVVAMFNIEMIGKPAVSGPNTAWITGFDRSDFGKILQEAVAGSEYSFYPDPYPDQNLFYRSDNATLARLGVPAHSISTTPIDVDPDYHQVTDEVSTLDLEHMTNTIRAIAVGAATIVSGQATPSRVDPATIN